VTMIALDLPSSPPPPAEGGADLLPARMLNEFVYCPRLCYLEWVLAEFTDNADTMKGRFEHRRVDRVTGKTPDPGREGGDEAVRAAESAQPSASDDHVGSGEGRTTALMLADPELGIIAKMDTVEFRSDGAVPVDLKKGAVPEIPGGVWSADRVQLCAQGLILRANGYACDQGEVYYAESRSRVRVEFSEQLIEETKQAVLEAKRLVQDPNPPRPLVDSPKCPGCSLVGICLPDEVNYLSRCRSEVKPEDVRRMVPARDDRVPVYAQSQDISLGKDGDKIQIRERGRVVESVRIMDTSQVNVFGNVQITTPLIQTLLREEIPVCYFSFGGWFNGLTQGIGHKNVELRRRQYRAAETPATSLHLAGRFVRGKILNCRTILRRNHKESTRVVLQDLTRLAYAATKAKDLATLLGLEGSAARIYFSTFANGLLRPPNESGLAFDFNGRNRRPPRDPVNCLLSFLYAILTKDATITAVSVGFDPYLGFYHQPRYGRPALALDLMEEFRSLVVDSVVLQLVNTGEIRGTDFTTRAGACSLTAAGRKRVITAYARRLETSVTHPVFGYSVSYRRILEIQARLLGRYLSGEIPEYPTFRTR
jgi:CRISP-associated protein Cas1